MLLTLSPKPDPAEVSAPGWNTPVDAVRPSGFAGEHIIAPLKEAEAGQPVKDLGRKHGVSEQTACRWKSKHGGTEVGEARRLRQFEDENARRKRAVADPGLDDQALEELARKTW